MSGNKNVREQLEVIHEQLKALNIQLESLRHSVEKKRTGEIKHSQSIFFMGISASLFLGLVSNLFVSFIMSVLQNPAHPFVQFFQGGVLGLGGALVYIFYTLWRAIKEFVT